MNFVKLIPLSSIINYNRIVARWSAFAHIKYPKRKFQRYEYESVKVTYFRWKNLLNSK